MNTIDLTFDSLPQAVFDISVKIDTILSVLSTNIERKVETAKILDVEEAVAYLNIKGYKMSRSTLYKYSCSKKIPCIKLGNRLGYETEFLDEWIKTKIIQSHGKKNHSCIETINLFNNKKNNNGKEKRN